MNIVFLYYINRSGSTYLCQQLSRYKRLMVCPEADILADKLLVSPGSPIKDSVDLDQAISTDNKFRSWKLDLSTITKKETNFEYFKSILEAYRIQQNSKAEFIVYKAERLFQLHKQLYKIKTKEENIIFTSIIRDVRGVCNSQLHTLLPGINRPFSMNPAHTALYWNSFVKFFLEHKHQLNATLLYEDLILGFPQSLINFISNVCRISIEPDLGTGDLEQRIPVSHLEIHKNITKEPIATRVDSWKKELKTPDLQLINLSSKKYLKKLNYPLPENIRPSSLSFFTFSFEYLNFKLSVIRKKAIFHLKQFIYAKN